MTKSICIFICMILALANGAQITGRISTSSNKTPSQTTITALDVINGHNYTTTTTNSEYSLVVPDSILVELQAFGTDMLKVEQWTVPGYFPVKAGTFQLDASNATVDISFEPCYTIVLTQYNSQGNYDRYSSFSVFNYVSDDNGSPLRGIKDIIYSNDNSQDTLGIYITLNKSVTIMTDVNVYGYNNMVIPINNNGVGYISEIAGGQVVNLNIQVASALLSRVINKNNINGYTPIPSSSISEMNNIMSTLSNSNDHSSIYNKTINIISDCIYMEDMLEVARARKMQDEYRTSNISIKTIDQNGLPTNNITISFTPKSYTFNFGVYGGHMTYNTSKAWELLIDAGINTATVDFWWSTTESTMGQLDNYDIINDRIEYLLSRGLKLRATGLFQPSHNIIPSYAIGLNFTEFRDALDKHISFIVGTYLTKFDSIEVSTDLNMLASTLGFNEQDILSLQKTSLDAIRNNAPGVSVSISSSDTYIPNNINSWNIPTKDSLSFASDYMSSGLYIDHIGYNIYNGINAEPQYTLGLLSEILDEFNNLDKTLKISKFTIPSSVSSDNVNKYMNQFYNIAFSKKNINEITWSNMISSTNGLFDNDMLPTSLYYTLKDIISNIRNKHNTIDVDNSGYIQTSTLGGLYRVNIIKNGDVIGQSDIVINEAKNIKLSVIYDNINNKAIISNNAYSGVIAGALPPSPAPQKGIYNNNNINKVNSIPAYGIFLIVFGTILFIASLSAMIIFIILRRVRIRSTKDNNNNIDIETSKPVGNTLPRDITDNINNDTLSIDIEVDKSISVSRMTEGPLAAHTIELEEQEDDVDVDVDEDGKEDGSSSDSDSMEDVELDEDDVRTTSSSSDDSEEEHL